MRRLLFLALCWILSSLLPAVAAPHPANAIPEPSALKSISKAALENNSAAQSHLLEEFATRYEDQAAGALAHLAIGYQSYQGNRYAAAKKHFEAARRFPTLVQDYAEYYLALSELALHNGASAAELLKGFAQRFPSSPLAPQAALQAASILVDLQRPAEAIAQLNGSQPALPQPDATFLLAESYRATKRLAEAVETYRKVYYFYPTSPKADVAEKRINALRRPMGKAFPEASVSMRQARADALYRARRWRDAQEAYEALAAISTGATAAAARVRIGACHFERGSTWPALTTLQKVQGADAQADAERLYLMAAAYRRLDRRESMEQQIDLLGKRYPDSEWHHKALVLAGNYHLLAKNNEAARYYYAKSYELFRDSDVAALGHWKVAWQAYRERRVEDARRLLQEHILTFPKSPQISAALYWLARLSENDAPADAALYYQKIVEAFPNYYYSMLARRRLSALPPVVPAATTTATAVPLETIQRRVVTDLAGSTTLEQPYRERGRLLASAWLLDWAIDEMRFVLAKDSSALWAGNEMARLERERGRYHVALRYAKQYVPSYFAQDTTALPRDTWELLFPNPYWDQIAKQAKAANLDPYLVAGLIRQESEFNPQARSVSNARGLMQLMPSTARYMAPKLPDPRARKYQLAKLFQPDLNIVYGTFYLRKVLDQFNGIVEYALAGYNAGENRVDEWLQDGPFEDTAEFVENIPFTETREYVQAVMRNAALYRELYPPAQ
jgi:soluble lytic murein transglycosylase